MKNSFEEQMHTIKNRCYLQIDETTKRKRNLLETDYGKEFVKKCLKELLKINNNKRDSRSTTAVAVFAEKFNRTKRNLSKKPVFERENTYCVSELPSITKQKNLPYTIAFK